MDHSDINKVARNHSANLLAAADDRGKVCVYRYPCPVDFNADHLTLAGHSSHVTNVVFAKDDTYLVSTGGNDTAVIQWKVVTPQSE